MTATEPQNVILLDDNDASLPIKWWPLEYLGVRDPLVKKYRADGYRYGWWFTRLRGEPLEVLLVAAHKRQYADGELLFYSSLGEASYRTQSLPVWAVVETEQDVTD